MVIARPLPKPVFAGLLVLAAVIAVAVLTLNNTLTVLAPSTEFWRPSQIKSSDPGAPPQPPQSVKSVKSAEGLHEEPGLGQAGSGQQGTGQPPTSGQSGVSRFADGGPDLVVAPAAAGQAPQTCDPKCPPLPAR